jgi:hypothetical protein
MTASLWAVADKVCGQFGLNIKVMLVADIDLFSVHIICSQQEFFPVSKD